MKRRVILSALTLVITACLGVALAGSLGTLGLAGIRTAGASSAVPRCPDIKPAPANDKLTADVSLQMDEIEKQVSESRGLCLTAGIPRELLDKDQLRKKVEDDFLKDYSRQDAADDVVTLAALGLVKPGFDLYGLYVDLYSEQVAGFYDDTEKKMYVISQMGFGGPDRMTYAHEFTHTLQDQNYDLRGSLRLEDEYCKKHSHTCSAVSALVEGDATLLQQMWFSKFGSKTDQQQVLEFSQTFESPVLDSAPQFLKQDFLFPYQAGYEFASVLYGAGGWEAVNSAYRNPPVSTEQILHPDRYPADKPVSVEIPDLSPVLGAGWVELDRDELGEWYMLLTLTDGAAAGSKIPLETARKAAKGWGGDRYATWQNRESGEVVFVYRSVWDTSADADEFWSALTAYGTGRWGAPGETGSNLTGWDHADGGAAGFSRTGKEILWISAPDAERLGSIRALFPGFISQ